MTQAEQVLAAFDKSRAGSKDKPARGEWGALNAALHSVAFESIDRSVEDKGQAVITYTFKDGSALWRYATSTKLTLKTITRAA